VLWQHDSPRLAALIRTMLVESDNHIAEQLLRAIGRAGSGVGSDAAGIAEVRHYLAERGVPADGLALFDGSGLSLDDRATPRMLATLLWRLRGTPEGDVIHASLPPMGNTAAQTSSDAAGLITAKTGNVGSVRGLVGSVDRQPGGALSFAFLDTAHAAAAFQTRRKHEEDTLHALSAAVP
jgi:D-alanyl-D-alanine carboxypeptidase/D-alanyl-D-alanine-endopeptidase (penicillin-binding protein 4)